MNSSSRIVCVGTADRTTEALSSALADREVVDAADASAVEMDEPIDCVVVGADDGATLADRLSAIRRRDPTVSILALADRAWSTSVRDLLSAGATDVVRSDGEPTADDERLLAGRVARTASESSSDRARSSPRPGDREVGERIERLRTLAAGLGDADSPSVVYDLLVEGADSVFSLDACAVAAVDGDELEVRAGRAPDLQLDVDPLGAEEGIAGRTIAEGRTVTVGDAREVSWARPTDDGYRSVLSVPIGEDAVFQLLSTTLDAYDENDKWLAELVAAIAEHAAGRTASETVLTAERDRFEALFENVPDAAIQYVVEGGTLRIEDVNAAFVRLFGYEPSEAVGASVRELVVPPDAADPVEASLESVRSDERVDEEVERLTVDGRRPFRLRSVPVSADGADRRGYLIYTDMRVQKLRERELQRKNERLDEFASLVSHDLRNPLSIAMGNVERSLDEDSLEPVSIVAEELDRMEQMIEDLLSLARQGEVVGDTSPVDLGNAAEEAWSHVSTADATLTVGDLPTVDGDRARVEELLENCFRNAIEHGGTDVEVAVGPLERAVPDRGDSAGEASEPDGDPAASVIGFFVEDDGPGFPDEHVDEVVEYGFTTADEGTGLGLAIVQEIAMAHGWSVEISNGGEGGARIECFFDGGVTAESVDSSESE